MPDTSSVKKRNKAVTLKEKNSETDVNLKQKKPASSSSSSSQHSSSARKPFRLVLLVISVICASFFAYHSWTRWQVSKQGPSSQPTHSPSKHSPEPTHSPNKHSPEQESTPGRKWLTNPLHPTAQREPSYPYELPQVRPLPETPQRSASLQRQAAIVDAFIHSWSAYQRDAWGYDEYHPLSKGGSNLSSQEGKGMGYTIVDTLDTLILMGLDEEYKAARDWVRDELNWQVPGRMNVFETTIRTLGGLLSASALIRNPPNPNIAPSEQDAEMFLEKAIGLADRLMPAFKTPTGVPLREVDLMTGDAFPDVDNNNSSSLAEATTVQLELKYLAHLTGDQSYWRTAERPMEVVRQASQKMTPYHGVMPIFLSPMTGQFWMSEIRLGSRGDSYYEYLIKQWLQTSKTENVYREMYDFALRGIKGILAKPSVHSDPPFVFTTELVPQRSPQGKPYMRVLPKQDHLVCFLGGSMMLGASKTSQSQFVPPISKHSQADPVDIEDWRIGHELIRTCMDTYMKTKTGLGPEITFFRTPQDPIELQQHDWYIKKPPKTFQGKTNPLIDGRNILRPETVESLFIAFHLTGDEIYREWGWSIFEAFVKFCKVKDGGFASIDDVDSENSIQLDKMETFWLSETLKYLYLLFSDQSLLPLDKWVLNTEAHPLPIFEPRFSTSFS